MKIQHLNHTFPYIIIDDFYNQEECSLIWEELTFLCYPCKLERSSIERGGAHVGGDLLKFTNDTYLDSFYSKREYSNILNLNRKVFNNHEKIFFAHNSWFFKNISFNIDYTQVVYYEDNDEYKAHQDCSLVTCLTWFYREPKKFNGGNLYFPEYDLEIEVLNNRMIIFPSVIIHTAKKVSMSEENRNKKLGRFCISQFLLSQMFVNKN